MTTAHATNGLGAILAERLGLSILGKEGNDVKTACPCCDSSDGGRVHQDSGVFHCYVCKAGLSRLRLAKKLLGNTPDAWELLNEIGLEQPRANSNGHHEHASSNGHASSPSNEHASPPVLQPTATATPCETCGGREHWIDPTGDANCRKCVRLPHPSLARGFVRVVTVDGQERWEPCESELLERIAKSKKVPAKALADYDAKTENTRIVFRTYGADGKPCSTFSLGLTGKGLNEKGKSSGVFLPHENDRAKLPAAGETWHVVEGVKDAAALRSLKLLAVGLPSSAMHADFAALFAGVRVVIVHDLDTAGVNGAKKSAGRLRGVAASVRIARLPGEIKKSKGVDVRDVLHGSPDGPDLVRKAIASAVEFDPATVQDSFDDNTDAISDITNAVEVESEGEDGRRKSKWAALSMGSVKDRIEKRTGDWPRRIDTSLFVPDGNSGVSWLLEPAALFGWFQDTTGIIHWRSVEGGVTKSEVFAELRRTAKAYESIEVLPHWPPLPNSFYACDEYSPGDGSALAAFLDFFTPATTIDRDLMQAMVVTMIWGGLPGMRPAFVITADAGRGKGKTAFAKLCAQIVGGAIGFSANDEMSQIHTRLLSPDATTRRIAMLDNVKSHRFSWAELEALITASVISGKRMYVGEGRRPNVLTWFITLNGASLSTDMAQRCVIIKVGEPARSGTWEEDATRFVEENRQRIIADCIAFLQSSVSAELPGYSRWATWEAAVLSRLPEPSDAQKVILERQGATDVEAEEACLLADDFAHRLEQLGYTPDTATVFIPSSVAADWFAKATGDKRTVTAATCAIKQLIGENRLPSIRENLCKTYGRGFVWTGDHADVRDPISRDLGYRLAEKAKGTC